MGGSEWRERGNSRDLPIIVVKGIKKGYDQATFHVGVPTAGVPASAGMLVYWLQPPKGGTPTAGVPPLGGILLAHYRLGINQQRSVTYQVPELLRHSEATAVVRIVFATRRSLLLGAPYQALAERSDLVLVSQRVGYN